MVLVSLFPFSKLSAQLNNITAGIKIGDQVPDAQIENIINYLTKTAKISDFKGKLLILDFWNTWCGSCIDEMPAVAILQQKFRNKIKIISVTSQKIKTVNDFIKNHQAVSNLNLTMALQDVNLSKLFPNKMLPHVVWISANGEYLGATDQADLSSAEINEILSTGIPNLKEFKKDNFHFNTSKPLFIEEMENTPFTSTNHFLLNINLAYPLH